MDKRQNILILAIALGLLFGFLPIFEPVKKVEADLAGAELQETILEEGLVLVQENSLSPVSNPLNPEPEVSQRLKVVVTGYSSTEDQTDSDPFITAAGTVVREGVIATNVLPFGTKIKLPELYGDKIFVVEDRMHWTKGYHIDIWFPDRGKALQFGAKITEALIISN